MKSPLNRPFALACALSLISLSASAQSAPEGSTPHVGFWGKMKAAFSSKKHSPTAPTLAPAPTQVGPPPREYQKLLRYSVSLGAKDDCDQIAQSISAALTTNASPQITFTSAPTAKCDVGPVTYQGSAFREGIVEINYSYTMQGWAGSGPTLNTDVIGGQPSTDGGVSDGMFGLFPTYQSCLAAAAVVVPGFENQTGAAPLAYYCQPSQYGGLSYADPATQTEEMQKDPARKFSPDRNFSLVIYSAGAETKRIRVYRGTEQIDPTDKIPEMQAIYDLLTQAGYTVAYPLTRAQIDADPRNVEGTYIAYYSTYKVAIQSWPVGSSANAQECQEQLPKAVQIWSALGAPGAQGLCDGTGSNEMVLVSVNGSFIMSTIGQDDDLTYTSYSDCMNPSEQERVTKARATDRKQGVLCFPDPFQLLGKDHSNQRYRAEFFQQ